MASRSFRMRNKQLAGPAAELQSMFAVLKTATAVGDGEDGEAAPPRVTVRGIHPTEEQAYTAAILDLMYDLEESSPELQPKVRAIAKTATLPLKERLKSLLSFQGLEERSEFVIKKSNVFPEEEKMKDMDALLVGQLLPCAYWDTTDEEDYDPEEDDGEDDEEEGEDDEEEDDDMEDLANEEDAMQGIEGSTVKGEEEGAAKAEDGKRPETTEGCV